MQGNDWVCHMMRKSLNFLIQNIRNTAKHINQQDDISNNITYFYRHFVNVDF